MYLHLGDDIPDKTVLQSSETLWDKGLCGEMQGNPLKSIHP